MVKQTFEKITDPDGGLRNIDTPTHMLVGEASCVFRTDNAEIFETKISEDAYRAGVLECPADKTVQLKRDFDDALKGLDGKIIITAKISKDGDIAYTMVNDAHAPFMQTEAMEEVKTLTRLYNKLIPQLTHLEIEIGRDLTLGLHRHQFPVLNRILGDSATGWVTTDNGPDNAGEGNLFLFKSNFYHEATSRLSKAERLNDPDYSRTSLIVRPNQGHWGEIVRQMRAEAESQNAQNPAYEELNA